jgi:hypothetical protein
MEFAAVSTTSSTAAEVIRADAEAAYGRIRSNGMLNLPTIKTLLARAWLAAKANLDALQQSSTQDATARLAKLASRVWGIDDVVGTSGLDRVTASIGYRDAMDRAATIDSPTQGLALLDQAEATGDELLARAIAFRFWQLGGGAVLDHYVSTRPNASAALAELGALQPTKMNVTDLATFWLPTPLELGGAAEWQIAGIAADESVVAGGGAWAP